MIWDTDSLHAFLIDPAAPSQDLLTFIKSNNLSVTHIINTHGHADHIGGNSYFKEQLKAKVCIHKLDAKMLTNSKLNLSSFVDFELVLPEADLMLEDDMILELGNNPIKVIHTPGHTQGCICLYCDELLISGDTLFFHDIGRTDLPGGSYEQIINSVKHKLFKLPANTIVLPGHGPSSTIIDEINNNPYVR
jgi:glyoxylase-like metal-dependent hydrolase (beta-lactamase superfamily II)